MKEHTNNYELLCFDPKTGQRIDLQSIKTPKPTIVSTGAAKETISVHVEDNGSVQFDYPLTKNEDGSTGPKSARQAVLNPIDASAVRSGKEFDFYIVFNCDIGAPTVTAWKLPRG